MKGFFPGFLTNRKHLQIGYPGDFSGKKFFQKFELLVFLRKKVRDQPIFTNQNLRYRFEEETVLCDAESFLGKKFRKSKFLIPGS